MAPQGGRYGERRQPRRSRPRALQGGRGFHEPDLRRSGQARERSTAATSHAATAEGLGQATAAICSPAVAPTSRHRRRRATARRVPATTAPSAAAECSCRCRSGFRGGAHGADLAVPTSGSTSGSTFARVGPTARAGRAAARAVCDPPEARGCSSCSHERRSCRREAARAIAEDARQQLRIRRRGALARRSAYTSARSGPYAGARGGSRGCEARQGQARRAERGGRRARSRCGEGRDAPPAHPHPERQARDRAAADRGPAQCARQAA